jgi:hypothetical protein
VIHVSPECETTKFCEPRRVPEQELATLEDLLQEERIGAVEDGEVDSKSAKLLLQVCLKGGEPIESDVWIAKDHTEV